MFKITYSREVWVNGEKVSEVTLTKKRKTIALYNKKVEEFECIVDAHNNENMVNEYDLTTQNTTKGETCVMTYYYAPDGLTILDGVAWEWVEINNK